MGLLDMLKEVAKARMGSGGGQTLKCPSCGETITSDIERCPKCGTHLASMFHKKCPNCKEYSELSDKRCKKCGYDFEMAETQSSKQTYRCPRCGYVADYFMLSCPACGVKFVS